MELISHNIKVGRRKGEVLVLPIGDIQWVGKQGETALKLLKRHIQWGVDNGAWFLGMGDYIDTFSPSNRTRLKGAALYDTAMGAIDDMARILVKELYTEALAPSKGRWLGLLEGHHFHEYREGFTSDQELCQLLNAPFLGTCAYVRLVLSHGKSGHMGKILIWCHHGYGSGRRIASPLNVLDQISNYWEADIYLIGHQSKKVAAPLDRCEPVWDSNGCRLIHRTKILACTGGFMRGYMVGSKEGNIPRGNYVEKAVLSPVALGGVLVKIRSRWLRKQGQDLWLPDLSVEQ